MTEVRDRGTVSPEADWDNAPSLLNGDHNNLPLTTAQCDMKYWFANVPSGTLRNHVIGHAPDVTTPELVREPGPLHDALLQEVAFRAVAEERAARALGYIVACAPDTASMEFYATQLFDETRHAMVFRTHLRDLGVDEAEVPATMERLTAEDRETILAPLESFGLPVVRDDHDFISGIVLLTILVEGVLAPSFELSERKWRPLDPVMADIEKGAGIDELRHLAVGTSIVKQYLADYPDQKDKLVDLVRRGMALWLELPVFDQLGRWEHLFQEGLSKQADLVGDYQIWEGRRLVDTDPDERIAKTFELTTEIHATRLAEMDLEEALT